MMSSEQASDLAEVVARTRGWGFRPANKAIQEVVEKIIQDAVYELEAQDVFNRIIVRDYRKIILSLPDHPVPPA